MLKTEKTGRMQNEIVTILLENVGEAPEINSPLAEMFEDVSVFDPSGQEKVGEAQVRREERRDVFPVVFLSKKNTKNQKAPSAENLSSCESDERRARKSGVPSNYLVIQGEKWFGRGASVAAISPLPADKGQDSDFLQDPLGKSTAIPQWRRLRGEIMRCDGLK